MFPYMQVIFSKLCTIHYKVVIRTPQCLLQVSIQMENYVKFMDTTNNIEIVCNVQSRIALPFRDGGARFELGEAKETTVEKRIHVEGINFQGIGGGGGYEPYCTI